MKQKHEDGYRYVRAYRVCALRRAPQGTVWRWAGWERVQGRMRRVATFTNQEDVTAFLLHLDQRTAP